MIKILGLIFICLTIQAYANSESLELLDGESANEYLHSEQDLGEFMKRSILRTGREQRREAKEKFEEKCERSRLTQTINKFSHNKKPRWCPELTEWDEWNRASGSAPTNKVQPNPGYNVPNVNYNQPNPNQYGGNVQYPNMPAYPSYPNMQPYPPNVPNQGYNQYPNSNNNMANGKSSSLSKYLNAFNQLNQLANGNKDQKPFGIGK